jgi:hypothetical protein
MIMMEASRITLEYMQKKEKGRYWTDRMRPPSVGVERTCRSGRIGSVCHRDTRRRDVWLVVFLSATTPAAAAAASFPGGSSLAALSEMQVTVHLASYSIHQVRAVMDWPSPPPRSWCNMRDETDRSLDAPFPFGGWPLHWFRRVYRPALGTESAMTI